MTAENGNIDYTQPLATLLKIATSVAHERAEHSQGAGWLTRGELDKEEYVRFLMMMYHVYDTLETGLEKHSNHPALATTYNPTLLTRAPSIASDIAYLLDVPEDSWSSHPLHQSLLASSPEAFKEYEGRLRYLGYEAPDPSPLLAHAYVRYLGDLSGGQTIRRAIAKAYVADRDEERGTQFYAFNKLGGGGPASAGDMRRIKDWFRAGMNTGGGDNTPRKQAIAEEAVYAFDLNMGLFTLLRGPSNSISAFQEPAEAPLGNPNNSLPPTPPPEFANGKDNSHVSSVNEKKSSSSSFSGPQHQQLARNSQSQSQSQPMSTMDSVLFLLFSFLSIVYVLYKTDTLGELAVWVRDRVTSIFG